MTTPYTPPVEGGGVKATVQRIGGYLAGMVMPNIAAFIAWGLITSLFIKEGWLPNATLAKTVDPMLHYLLPALIAYTGGKLVHRHRGGVVGAIAAVGVAAGVEQTMLLAAMIVGPLTAYLLKLWDDAMQPRIKPGFEMLVDNFSAGILGGAMALLGVWGIGPIMRHVMDAASNAVDWLVSHHLLPLVSTLVEPGKVLFLNNAINHGVFGPLGAEQASHNGKSILFMIETNPGPGLGLLVAFFLFGPRALRASTPAAMVIQFLGGIHEIYFPYVLMKPRLILAMIAGGMTGVATFMVTDAGLVATPAPGSIFAYLAETPKGGFFGVLLGVVLSCAVTFAVASVLLGFGKDEPAEDDELAGEELSGRDREAVASKAAADQAVAANKAASKRYAPTANTEV